MAHRKIKALALFSSSCHNTCDIAQHLRLSYLLDVVEGVDLWRQAAVDAEELLVHEGSQRQAVEGLHASVVHALGVLDLA